MKNYILKGDICYTSDKDTLHTYENHYVVCIDGKCTGVFREIPEEYQTFPVKDYSGCLIIPGLSDLHVHAPQFSYRGMGMDKELLDWLDTYAFPEEAKFADLAYAEKAYTYFVKELRGSTTTRASIFATLHREATELLMEMLEQSGLKVYVGKVNMDRNSPDNLREINSAEETERWLTETAEAYSNVKPILTPRFTPSCTDELMEALGKLQKIYRVPMQSHLSENPGEVEWVSKLCLWSAYYGEAYERFGLFGGVDCPTIMAHCVYSGEKEMKKMKEQGVFIAHCPQSNMNVSSGIAPVRKYLDAGMRVGLGSDVAGGSHLALFRAITDAIQVSKLYWRIIDQSAKPLTVSEAFYMATKGGGEFFGKVGSFEKDYEFDAVVIKDADIPHPQELTLAERLERALYLSDDRHIVGKYVAGKEIFLLENKQMLAIMK